MTVATNTSKTITKIVTFYSDGTFTEFSPSPYMPTPMPPGPFPYTNPPWATPWYQNGPICNPASQMWGVTNANKTDPGGYGK